MSYLKKLRRMVLDLPRVRALIDGVAFYRAYGTFRPTKLRLPHSGNTLHVDRREPRGRGVLKHQAAGQPDTKAIWHQAIRGLQPMIVIDVGLNYGEFLFDEKYTAGAILLGVEANPALRGWLEKSAADHPNSAQIRLAFALASDRAGPAATFYVDPTSSGRSSAVLRDEDDASQACEVPTVTVDSFFDQLTDEDLATRNVVFKVDVEGYEVFVLRGMRRLFGRCKGLVGIIEFNSTLLRKSGADPDAFLLEISDRFPRMLVLKDGQFRDLAQPSLAALRTLCGAQEVEVDLILFSSASLLDSVTIRGRKGASPDNPQKASAGGVAL
ncbi:MAG TPA: FkbM family methyltransferase [Pirellulales bacterium]|jgi:FkbM family methyltransferase